MGELSDASFLGKLLVLPANVILDWKEIARYKHSSLFVLIVSKKGIKFYNIDTRCQPYKTFYGRNLRMFLMFAGKAEAYPSGAPFSFSPLGKPHGLTHKF